MPDLPKPDLDELRRTYSRIEPFTTFHPDQRIWWIYMRNAAIEVASRYDFPDLTDACDRVKEFPEKLPLERDRWLALRETIGLMLEQTASE